MDVAARAERVPLRGLDRRGVRAPGDGALVRAAQRGSADAFGELFRRHWAQAHRAAFLVTRDAAAADDVAQEAFLAAIAALDRFDRRRPFAPWLHRIVVNRALDWARAHALRREVPEEAAGEAMAPEGGGGLAAEVLAALADLSPEQRAVIVLRHVLGFTPGEIASALDLPRGTVNSRLRRGLDAVQTALRAGEEDVR